MSSVARVAKRVMRLTLAWVPLSIAVACGSVVSPPNATSGP
jgi:hypothetical protein